MASSSSSQPSAPQPPIPVDSDFPFMKYLPLYKAILRGDLKEVEKQLSEVERHESGASLAARITSNSDTALHVAVGTGTANHIVKFLLAKMSNDQMKLGNKNGNTVLAVAAIVGNVEAAKMIKERLPGLISMKNENNYLPIIEAARHGHKTMVFTLLPFPDEYWDLPQWDHNVIHFWYGKTAEMRLWYERHSGNMTTDDGHLWDRLIDERYRACLLFVHFLISAGFYDFALSGVQSVPVLAVLELYPGETLLSAIARKPSAFPSGRRLRFYQKSVYIYQRGIAVMGIQKMMTNISSCIQRMMTHISSCIQRMMTHILSFMEKYMPFIFLWFIAIAVGGIEKMMTIIGEMMTSIGEMMTNISSPIRDLMRLYLITSISLYKSIFEEKKWMHQQKIFLVRHLCKNIIWQRDHRMSFSILKPALLLAAELGVHEVVEEIVKSFPYAMLSANDENHNAFHLAVINRHEGVFNLIFEMNGQRHLLLTSQDNSGNNILHLAGKLPPQYQLNRIPGAALQMQRELQWFKAVEKVVPPTFREDKNTQGKTPAIVFSEKHEGLVKEGEKWMKDAATSCSVATALIATVVFAAAITVPGGNNSIGLPNFYKEIAFTIFSIADSISLFSSIAAIFMFLSILTARYAEGDFLYALPKRLILGLFMLFLSVTAMMVAFGATVYLVFAEEKRNWVLGLIIGSAILPVSVFAYSQFPLLLDLAISTYGPSIFGKQTIGGFYEKDELNVLGTETDPWTMRRMPSILPREPTPPTPPTSV